MAVVEWVRVSQVPVEICGLRQPATKKQNDDVDMNIGPHALPQIPLTLTEHSDGEDNPGRFTAPYRAAPSPWARNGRGGTPPPPSPGGSFGGP